MGGLFVGGPSTGQNILQHRFYKSMNIELFYLVDPHIGNNDSFFPFLVSAKTSILNPTSNKVYLKLTWLFVETKTALVPTRRSNLSLKTILDSNNILGA